MTELAIHSETVAARRVSLEAGYSPGGVMHAVARELVAGELEEPLSMQEASAVVKAPRGLDEPITERWVLVGAASKALKAAAEARRDDVLEFVRDIDMLHDESVSEEELLRVVPSKAVYWAKGGANKTSIVRRALGNDVIAENARPGQILFQTGSLHRVILPEKTDADNKVLGPNPEFVVAEDIADPEHLQALGSKLTEFGLNLATALSDGYKIINEIEPTTAIAKGFVLKKPGLPMLYQLAPALKIDGLEDGLSAIKDVISITGKQIVNVTNGPYRGMDELLVQRWAQAHPRERLLAGVAFGDELGFEAQHRDAEFVTGERALAAYLGESASLARMYWRRPIELAS